MATSELQEAARQERNRYAREWRAKNKDKVKANTARYWERRVKRILAEREATNGGTNEND